MILQPPPLSLYVHLPWCVKKCPYCDFNAHPVRDGVPSQNYLQCLIQDCEQDLPSIWGRPIETIFFGGGTPSLFSPEEYAYLIGQLRSRLNFSQSIEITMEANPGALECGDFAAYREAGINRISLGVQSFQDTYLKSLGRVHNRDAAFSAIESIKAAKFNSFNVDIMHGLPDQTLEDALFDLNQAIDLGAPHISWYQLTLEANTLFAVQKPHLPSDDVLADIEVEGFKLLGKNGFERYEISAFCQEKKVARHNLNYWQFGDYLGIGAGAHSKITDVATQSVNRVVKHKHPKAYMDESKPYIQEMHAIEQSDLPVEFMLNAMRLKGGVSKVSFESRTGLPLDVIRISVDQAKSKGLLIETDDIIRPSDRGLAFLNDLLAVF